MAPEYPTKFVRRETVATGGDNKVILVVIFTRYLGHCKKNLCLLSLYVKRGKVCTTGSPFVIEVEDTEDLKPKDGRR